MNQKQKQRNGTSIDLLSRSRPKLTPSPHSSKLDSFIQHFSRDKETLVKLPSRGIIERISGHKAQVVSKCPEGSAQTHYLNSKYSSNERLRMVFNKHMLNRYQSGSSYIKPVLPAKSILKKKSEDGSSFSQIQNFDPKKPERQVPTHHLKHRPETLSKQRSLGNFSKTNSCLKPHIIINNYVISSLFDEKNEKGRRVSSPKSTKLYTSFHEPENAPKYFIKKSCFKTPNKNRITSLHEPLNDSSAVIFQKPVIKNPAPKKKLHPEAEMFRLPFTHREAYISSNAIKKQRSIDGLTEKCPNDTTHLEPELIQSEIVSHIEKFNEIPETKLRYYQFLKEIGKGSFGVVHLGLQRLTLRRVAIKKIKMNDAEDSEKLRKIEGEIKVMQKLSHCNVLRLFEYFQHKNHVFIILEYCFKGDLQKHLRTEGHLKEEKARKYFFQIASGLQHIHDNNIIHRDIKPDNILIDEFDQCKICDFGISRAIDPEELIREQCGTPAYLAPEIVLEKGHRGFGPDIWALGVLLYGMLTGCVLFGAETIPELNANIVKGEIIFPEKPLISEEAKSLIKTLVNVDIEKRPSIAEVLKHPWLHSTLIEDLEVQRQSSGEGLNANALSKAAALGFPLKLLIESLQSGEMNHGTVSYHLYDKDFESK